MEMQGLEPKQLELVQLEPNKHLSVWREKNEQNALTTHQSEPRELVEIRTAISQLGAVSSNRSQFTIK